MLSSCQQGSSPSNKAIQQIRLNLSQEPATMDPRKGGDIISSHMHFMFFEGLTRLNEDGTITPAQAKSVDISSDGRTYTFHLRGTRWSNGAPVTAGDFEKAWKDILDPLFPSMNAHLLYPIKNAEGAKKGLISLSEVGIHAPDEMTLIVTLEQPTPYFLDLTTFCVFFPVSKAIDAADPRWAYEAGDHFVCNGPYHLAMWKHHNAIVAQRNPFYWEKAKVLADSIHFSMVDNPMTALQLFENGELDVIGNPLSPLPSDAIAVLEKTGRLQTRPIPATTMICFNTEHFPFSNVNIRKAFALAINREEIVTNITQLGEQLATSAIPSILKQNGSDVFFKDHDEHTAQHLFALGLQELGLDEDSFPEISYHFSNSGISGTDSRLAQTIQQQLLKVLGVKIKLEGMEGKILMSKLIKRDYTAAQTIWFAQYNDPMSILERFKYKSNVKNYSHWENAEFIDLLNRSAFETGEERLAILEKAEAIFLNEMPVIPIYHQQSSYMVQPDLNTLRLSPIGDIYFHDIDMTKKRPTREYVAEK